MATAHNTRSAGKDPDRLIDLREQLFNQCEVGSFGEVQLPLANVVDLHAIALDLDLHLYRPDAPVPLALDDPKRFWRKSLGPMLARDPALRNAEVRDTGRNLHVIIWFDTPVAFRDDAERDHWSAIVRVVQAALPIDPDQPGITALTRPVGSINGKTGRAVATLRPGTPTPVADVLALYDRMARSPFRTLMNILLGSDRVAPCPICRAAGSTLRALDQLGQCYGSCGRVELGRLYDAYLLPRAAAVKEETRGEA